MFLKHVHIKNFRGLEEISLSFENEFTVGRKQTLILGENGSGKSNLLKAIALVTAGSNALGDLLGNSDEWISFDSNSCEIDSVLVTKRNEERNIKLVINRGDTLISIFKRNEESLNEIDQAIKHANRNYFVIGYGASRRSNVGNDSIRETQNILKNERSINVGTLFNPEQPLNSLSSWAKNLDYRSKGGDLQIITDILNDLLPGVRFHSIDREKGVLLFEVGKSIVPLHLLSEGYKNVSTWLGDLLYRINVNFPDYNSPLNIRGILLIDEIDLHLHPKWQRFLFDYLSTKLPNFQIIATTHSPLTAQQADKNELYFLEKDPMHGNVTLKAFQGVPKQMLVHQLLMSPLFGLTTDESFEVEQDKKEYKELKGRKRLSDSEQQRIDELKISLSNLPIMQRTNTALENYQLEAINAVRKELASRQSKND
ncbi:AAA family ATPase [Runella aurantiaca]|uniref:DUF2813 domain-containing protein n=1 Tax=Runella aurantiaca TaxID=2282308 RepID=A0A369IKA4_9BACT|nr:AAA family ATPase [Runella aurantiaca]RDB07803.1 DUF2813 domain-containing protein [Runella aurantiaca]